MEKYRRFIIPAFIVLALTGIFALTPNKNTQITQSTPSPQTSQASMTIDDGVVSKSFAISQFVGKTALEATTSVLENKVTLSGSGESAFITALGDRTADPEKHEFWELLINGKAAEVGAGSYTIQNGDILLWRISTY